MIKIISVAFVLALASSSTQAMPLAAIQQPDSMVTQVVAGCGVGMTPVNGVARPDTTNVKPAGVHDGMDLLARNTTEPTP